MGYERKRKIYLLDFTGTELDGLTVRARGASFGRALEMAKLGGDVSGLTGQAQLDAARTLLTAFAEVLVSWDLLDDGVPVPATAEGLATLDESELVLLITAWQTAVAGVAAPLGQTSSGGGLSEALSTLPMDPLSESLAS